MAAYHNSPPDASLPHPDGTRKWWHQKAALPVVTPSPDLPAGCREAMHRSGILSAAAHLTLCFDSALYLAHLLSMPSTQDFPSGGHSLPAGLTRCSTTPCIMLGCCGNDMACKVVNGHNLLIGALHPARLRAPARQAADGAGAVSAQLQGGRRGAAEAACPAALASGPAAGSVGRPGSARQPDWAALLPFAAAPRRHCQCSAALSAAASSPAGRCRWLGTAGVAGRGRSAPGGLLTGVQHSRANLAPAIAVALWLRAPA